MGPIRRRGLGVAVSLLASPAMAEVCDKERPGWDGTAVTAWDEMIISLSAPPALALLILTAIALRMRSQWMGLGTVVLWTILATLMTSQDAAGIRASAIAEGCIGPPTLFLGIVTAICAGTILYTAPYPKRRSDTGEE